MVKIFISYAKKDTRELALALDDALNAIEGISCWVDRSLRAGRSWELQIELEIDQCDWMIVLYSPDINRHKHGQPESYVLNEIAYAKYTVKKPILPIMAQTTTPPISLTRAHYIDYTLPGVSFDALIDDICEAIEVTRKPHTASPPTQPVSPPAETTSPRPEGEGPGVRAILPPPFAWIDIPAGRVTLKKGGYLEEDKTFDVPAFQIAKYPITNAQFTPFIEAGGYRERRYWTKTGWQVRASQGWTEPRYWQNNKFNGAEQPVVGVSWYEAIAYCNWLNEALALKADTITLPTEQQWQRAAQGDDGRTYPWGNKFDPARANTAESGIGQTTPVTAYEGRDKGNSPYGVVDMAGNVWEWTLTAWADGSTVTQGSTRRVLRGGAWVYARSSARAASREFSPPSSRSDSYGFRLLRAPSL